MRTQLLQTLQEEGLERIPALGLPFDPAVAESVGSQPVQDPEHHHVVVKELLRGYRLNGRIARPARVVIGVYAVAEASAEDDGLIGADEVAPPALPPGRTPRRDRRAESHRPELPADDRRSPGSVLEPTLEPIPEDEGRSLEEIIAAAERSEAESKSQAWRPDEGEAVPAAPLEDEALEDEALVAEPADDEALLSDGLQVTLLPEPRDD